MTEPDPSEHPEVAEPDGAEVADGRRYPSTIGGAFYLLVLLVSGIAIAIAWREDWRLGIRMFAGALCLAAFVRLLLPAKDAGMLAVRSRTFDVVLLGTLGGLLFFLASTIPDQPI